MNRALVGILLFSSHCITVYCFNVTLLVFLGWPKLWTRHSASSKAPLTMLSRHITHLLSVSGVGGFTIATRGGGGHSKIT